MVLLHRDLLLCLLVAELRVDAELLLVGVLLDLDLLQGQLRLELELLLLSLGSDENRDRPTSREECGL